MKQMNLKKLTLSAMLIAVAVSGSLVSFPVFGSMCAPVQHMVNVVCAVLLGPWYGITVAFIASLIRNVLGLGSVLAFPGSMFGALICGLAYRYTKNVWATCLGEVFGTAVIGGIAAYPLAVAFFGEASRDIAFYTYIIPFFISTSVGAVLSTIIIAKLQNSNVLGSVQTGLEG